MRERFIFFLPCEKDDPVHADYVEGSDENRYPERDVRENFHERRSLENGQYGCGDGKADEKLESPPDFPFGFDIDNIGHEHQEQHDKRCDAESEDRRSKELHYILRHKFPRNTPLVLEYDSPGRYQCDGEESIRHESPESFERLRMLFLPQGIDRGIQEDEHYNREQVPENVQDRIV